MSESSTTIIFPSIKAAEAAGFHRLTNWEYGGTQITVTGVLLVKDSELAVSETAWRKDGRKVIPGTLPHAIRMSRVGGGRKSITYGVYRRDQTVTMRQRRPARPAVAHPLTGSMLLAAIFSVNRSAKRYRDAARSCYLSGAHGFAKSQKRQKKMLYELKDRGLVTAYEAGLISAVGLHGTLAVYRGEGYCFHSPLRPEEVNLQTTSEETVFVEAKPRKASEMRLRDAVATLEQTENDLSGFTRHAMPSPGKRRQQNWDDEGDIGDDHWDDGEE